MATEFKWTDEKTWPLDGPGYTALPRVVAAVGRAMHGAEWLGREAEPSASDSERNRFVATKAKIQQLCSFGKMQTAARPLSGGKSYEVEAAIWNTEAYDRFFERCQYPASVIRGGMFLECLWIYVADESLSRFTGLSRNTTEASDLSHLSPYMQLAIRCVRENMLTKDNQSKKAVIEQWLHDHWSEYDLPPSPTLVEYLATIVREPSSQQGRGRTTHISSEKGPTLKR